MPLVHQDVWLVTFILIHKYSLGLKNFSVLPSWNAHNFFLHSFFFSSHDMAVLDLNMVDQKNKMYSFHLQL